MLLCVCLNPSVDRTLFVGELRKGGMNRAVSQSVDYSGKGVNVSAALSALGERPQIAGFFRECDKDGFESLFDDCGIRCEGIWLPGRTRVNVKIIENDGTATEINEPGTAVSASDVRIIRERILALADESEYCILTGSLPPGCPSDFYADIVRNTKAKCAVDAHGQALKLALEAKPFLIKPNLAELCELTGKEIRSTREAAVCAKELTSCAEIAVVSLGETGAVLACAEGVYAAAAPRVRPKSTVGAGDSMVAGLIYSLAKKPGDFREALVSGCAAGAAGAMTEGTKALDAKEYLCLISRIETSKAIRATGE